MDDIYTPKTRKGHLSRPSTASQADGYSRVRGRTPLRQYPPVSYGADSTAEESGGAGPSKSTGSGGVNKLWSNVRRSMSSGGAGKKSRAGVAAAGMYSTPVESLPPMTTPHSYHDSPATSPTIEQIAMGLHISRTPHLGSSSKAYHPRSRQSDTPEGPRGPPAPSRATRPSHARRGSAPPIILPPPPARSSLKKQPPASTPSLTSNTLTPSDSNASLSTLTSTTPSTPRSNRSASTSTRSLNMSFSKLQFGMRLLLPRKNSAPTPTTLSDDDSASSETTPRKVVRFSVVSGESTGKSTGGP
ncbi:hypothetical protein PHLGIDRAFT_127828 [Phlebiopsis gigantea 11061_1 CR5-6]|uniref:Uncharacterized protein n=1 Tax=Phlebiopsis gigantea (strain 11061_1 CR5-6) TaxID=745531 RepID=A0A0C3NPP9_PHLG1|nr:hypothetical protein PHLGIDRAFT_127828 [Phlebiopsis gigantea 11061_1 CR5-6]